MYKLINPHYAFYSFKYFLHHVFVTHWKGIGQVFLLFPL